jgi:heptosyltransferase-2
LTGSERFLTVAPGASRPTKRWPVQGFIAAAGEAAGPHLTVAVLGDDKDHEVAQRLVHGLSAAGTRAVDLTGRLSLLGSAAVIERARALLTNDSGLMHVADALDVPLAAVFGPTSRELGFFPSGPNARVIERTGLACRPCTLHGDQSCPRGHHACMLELAPDEVAEAVREVMDRRP